MTTCRFRSSPSIPSSLLSVNFERSNEFDRTALPWRDEPARSVRCDSCCVPVQRRPFHAEEEERVQSVSKISLDEDEDEDDEQFDGIFTRTFTGADVIIDDDLGAIEEITELRFPNDQIVRMMNTETVIES